MSAELLTKLGTISEEIKQRFDAQKAEFGAFRERIDKTLTKEEYEARATKAKEEFASKAEVQALFSQLANFTQPLDRAINLVGDADLSHFRSVANLATTPAQARGVYDEFLLTKPQNDKVERLHELSTKLTILRTYGGHWHRQQGLAPYSFETSRNLTIRSMWAEYQKLQREVFPEEFYQRAFDTSDASEWVPDILASDLLRYIEVRGAIIPLFRSFPMPAALYRIPFTTGAGKASRWVEQTSSPSTAVNYTDGPMYTSDQAPAGRATFDAERFRSKLISSREFIEESIVPILDFMILDTADGLRRAIEDTIINGDAESAGLDSDLSFAVTRGIAQNRTAWDGLRDNAESNDSASATVIPATSNHATIGNMVTQRTAMGRYGIDPNDLTWICGLRSYLDLLDLTEMITVDKLGSRATILTGQVGSILGTPVVVSEYVRQDLQASGKYTTSTGSQTIMILVHRPSWWLGNWRGITTEPERIPGWNMDVIWAWWSGDFQVMTTATEPTVAVISDID